MFVELLSAPHARHDGLEASRVWPRSLPILALFIALLAMAPSTLSAGASDEEPSTASGAAGTPESAAGWRIYRDPATGRLLSEPLPGQSEALSAKWARRQAESVPLASPRTFPIVLRGRPIGTGVALEGRFVTSTVVRTLPDGTLSVGCQDAEHGLDDHGGLAGPPSKPTADHPER